MRKVITALVLTTLLVSCKESIANFTDAQPVNKSNLKSFPKKMQGVYHNAAFDTDLTIENHIVMLTTHFNDTVNTTDLQHLSSEINVRTQPLNDSLFIATYAVTDTVFALSNQQVLRKWKGHYFLNSQHENKLWEVKKLTYKDNIVSVSAIVSEEAIAHLDELTETTTDSIRPKTYTLDKKQFKQFVRDNGFSENNAYVRKK
ncbi:MAG: hypothetical protein Q4G18_03725 [Myroides sp.]|nr:hypothetical protein [Myroides sp.]